jgi:hypothetical protein
MGFRSMLALMVFNPEAAAAQAEVGARFDMGSSSE